MAMGYSIFGPGGNLLDYFEDRGAALEYLASTAQSDPDIAEEVFLFASDNDTGEWVGKPLFASSVSIPA